MPRPCAGSGPASGPWPPWWPPSWPAAATASPGSCSEGTSGGTDESGAGGPSPCARLATECGSWAEEHTVRVIMSDFISLDGVVQAPGGPDEDTEGGFTNG